MSSFENDFGNGLAGAFVAGIMTYILGYVISVFVTDEWVVAPLLSSLVPIISLLSIMHDCENLDRGRIALFFGSTVGSLFCWMYL